MINQNCVITDSSKQASSLQKVEVKHRLLKILRYSQTNYFQLSSK